MYQLYWQPPYDWAWIAGFLAARTVSGVDSVSEAGYQRALAIGPHHGLIRVRADAGQHCLVVTLSPWLLPVADEVLARVRRMFDLDCPVAEVADVLGGLARHRPGIRLPGCMDPFEQIVRAVLGQLVSVAMAARLTSRLVALAGTPLEDNPGWWLFPTPAQLAAIDPVALKGLGMPLARAQCLGHIARACLDGEFPLRAPDDPQAGIKALTRYPGIGPWTASYFALRGWQSVDVFLADDYLIRKRFPAMTSAAIRNYARRWQPWRSYALLHIWHHDGWQPQ
ncbi:DNA-3-methyladenine glycosylase II [Shimwellia blattae DSM 4481 = NBRC 105725]|uniref:DNA-3-methyladenine glycosylase II n=1 Tax=Shimwellia blattae (strain ATCC 29907 / DSM 4481 / JCM 1650 / NBRC 105725 / CDC 9005-74) TaxID=630626 RepID=I2B7N9_SHIBC|nr:DNA-3-methyladenine glycosylase 2 [Shimwellia blattae]AFJ46543.1 DNA-3-methyladenine glycosylase II [Shimwellia blattae DSM 4481 = NBRC 105725]GAB80122.1 3-methyladenine-DNA glycosylase II [Shimwellia blattae DSM 4481 = NBRC 105725]VEC22145.1 DNA-3-methyladenine glycosylase 2 [Shimwellia blattae]